VSENNKISSVLFVCLGNICRSPSAEAVFRQKVKERGLNVLIDSAGTAGYHTGSPPDERSQAAGEARGFDFSDLHCRRVNEEDFEKFDYIVAMDDENVVQLKDKAPIGSEHKIVLFMSFSQIDVDIVPDPYYGGKKGFEYVLDLIEDASDGLIDHIIKHH
jgi:protein-tyrosine phosphatase